MSNLTVRLTVCVILGMAGCSSATRPLGYGGDSFGPNALASYDHFSDGGNPWHVSPDTLKADGVGVQSVLIRKNEGFDEGWVAIETDRADDAGLVLNFVDNEHYYLLAIRDDSAPDPRPHENLELYERSGAGPGGFKVLWVKDIAWPRGTNHRVRFFTTRKGFVVFVDEKMAEEIPHVPAFTGYRFGIRHYGSGDTWHDRFRNFNWSAATIPQGGLNP